MKPLFRLDIGQRLTLIPQLQQAIRLLQLSTCDLQQEIQKKIESNPMLEILPANKVEAELSKIAAEFSNIESLQLFFNQTKCKHFNKDSYRKYDSYGTTLSLQEYLHWQLELAPIKNVNKVIATAIKATIKKLIAVENPRPPLSDSNIRPLINKQGINVARRTVAKYRDTMSIAPSSARKSIYSKTTMEQTMPRVKH